MSFSPVVIGGGYTGWRMLRGSLDRQMGVMAASPQMQRDEAYFREKIGKVNTADDLVGDRRLLRMSLEAFGLGGDLNSRAFIRKILSEGTLSKDALSNKLADKRYTDFARAFGFDLAVPRTKLSDFPDKILGAYKDKSFETAVGTVDDTMRLALNAERELRKIADGTDSETAKWFKILGAPPLRKVVETIFSLPASFAAIDLDQQLGVVKDKSRAIFGSSDPSVFREAGSLDKALRLFTIRSDTPAANAGSRSAVALTLLGDA